MSRINLVTPKIYTHGGVVAKHINPYQELRRSVLSCFLWEDEFYESGEDIATRIKNLANRVEPEKVAELAIEARTVHGLRHVSLLLLLNLVERRAKGTKEVIAQVISRADELAELLAMYWKDGKKPIGKQLKKGLALAFHKFNEYNLAKYNRPNAIKLKDVMFMVRPNPMKAVTLGDHDSVELFHKVAENELETPNTWEVRISAIAKDDHAARKVVWEDLITTGQLGYMALLRNLRNMAADQVDEKIIKDAIEARKGARWVLPFRYTAAARIMPQFEPSLDKALIASIDSLPKLPGRTIVLVDVSPSMDARLSAKSDMSRMDAAATLASIINGDVRVFSFSNNTVEVPPRKGMAGVDAIVKSQPHNGTLLGKAISHVNAIPHDRLIVITDEQSQDKVGDPVASKAYMINVASYKNGVGYGKWIHIDGFSENVIRYIAEVEGVPVETNSEPVEDV